MLGRNLMVCCTGHTSVVFSIAKFNCGGLAIAMNFGGAKFGFRRLVV